MDIWDWVGRAHDELEQAGHQRLSQLLRHLPDAVCDNHHARVDAIYPEALALARAAENPWLEVFVRHWNLQSRILHRHEVEDWMGEAVALLEFANRPETRECPQSVCVTQDLVNCYGNRDGPGFADERIAASRETLGRIDATWPCYCCIGGELVEALLDAGRPADALAEIDRLEAELARTDEWHADPMGESRATVLRVLGRHDEALALIDRLMDEAEDEDSRVARRVERARLLGLMGRAAEGAEALPAFEAIEGTHSLYRGWVEAVALLVRAGALPNEWVLERRLRDMFGELRRNGVIRHGLHLCIVRGDLALDRGRLATARRALADGRALIPLLRAPLDGPALLDRLAAEIDYEADALERGGGGRPHDPDDGDPEADLEWLAAARAKDPDDPDLRVAEARAWRALGELERGEAALRAAPPGHPAVALELGRILAARGDWAAVQAIGRRLCALDDGEAQQSGRQLRLTAARRTADRAAERAVLEEALAAAPDDPWAVMMLADARAEDDLRAALALLDARLDGDPAPDPGPWDWRRILIATRLDEWGAVRRSAARLGMTFTTGSGPIDEVWEPIRLRVEDAVDPDDPWALRTGPVTARVASIAPPELPCRFGDEVIFDPLPVETPDEEPGDTPGGPYTYRQIEVRAEGGYRAFVLDARHPGDAAVEALSEAVQALGGELRDVTGDGYVVVDPEGDDLVFGLYARLAVPADRLRDLDALLTKTCADWPGAAVWTELLAALGERDRLAAQRAVMERWGM